MFKKLSSFLFAILFLFVFALSTFAQGMPFEKIEGVPDKLFFKFSYPNEGSELIETIFTVPDDICKLAAKSSADQEKYYGSAFECCVQYDWSVDSDSSWNYSKEWDTLNSSAPFQRLTGSFVEKNELFWLTYEETANLFGADVIKTTSETTTLDDGSEETVTVRTFDFDNHELFVRARFFIYEYATDVCHTGEWSKAYSVNDAFNGKAKTDEYKGDDKGVVPILSSVKVIDDSSLCFDINFDDSFKTSAYNLKCVSNIDFTLESQVRFNGGEWNYWILENELYPYIVGTKNLVFGSSHSTDKIEYRCRLIFNAVNDLDGYVTGWSDYVLFEGGKAEIIKNDDPFGEKAEAAKKAESEKCGVCGFCTFHPFNICIFIWIGIAVLIVAIIVYNVLMSKRKKKREAVVKERERAARETSISSSDSIINIDLEGLSNKSQTDTKDSSKEKGEN